MASHGAAVHLPQTALTPQKLAEVLAAQTRAGLLAMAQKARPLAQARAAARVADEIEALVKKPAVRA
jgi:UDP-N-acetylglucosamine--N-acetylmuramyl-(pentapeptide) pyrophosphoryl-undecaprenol N-acetylglucosamine transferase